jgi:hypothetical protein
MGTGGEIHEWGNADFDVNLSSMDLNQSGFLALVLILMTRSSEMKVVDMVGEEV